MFKNKKILFILIFIIILIIILFFIMIYNNNKLENSKLSTDELIYYFEKNNYTFEFSKLSDVWNETPEEVFFQTLKNDTYSITKASNSESNSIAFQNKMINDDCYFIKISNDNNTPNEQTEKNQKYAYKDFLKENQITEKQLVNLIDYCFSTKYITK